MHIRLWFDDADAANLAKLDQMVLNAVSDRQSNRSKKISEREGSVQSRLDATNELSPPLLVVIMLCNVER